MEDHEPFEGVGRLLLVSGTSGVGLRELYEGLRGAPPCGACVLHFEDILLGLAGLPRGYGIVHLVTMATVSRPQVVEQFRRAVARLGDALSGCGRAIVFAHLSYIVGGSIFPNPVVRDILGLGRWRGLLYLMDDYYDALHNIYRKAGGKGPTGMEVYRGHYVENVDPISYMEWRGYDLNQLGRLEAQGIVDEIHILAVKHPWSVLERLLSKLLGADGYRTAYISHPISAQRGLYSRLPYHAVRGPDGLTLEGMPLVLMIEAFKDALLSDPHLIPYSPTTIDEYVITNAKAYYEDTFKCHELLPEWTGCRPPKAGVPGDLPVPSLYLLRRRDRWPVPGDTVQDRLGTRVGEDPLNIVLILSKADVLAGRKALQQPTLRTLILMEVCQEWVALGTSRGRGAYMTQASRKLHTQIKQQIEMRDYQYVAQSDSTIAVLPAVIVDGQDARFYQVDPGIYLLTSQGMEAEIHRAKALGKPIQLVILPVCAGTLREWLTTKLPVCEARELVSKILRSKAARCGEDIEVPEEACAGQGTVARLENTGAFMSCINRLVEGQIFGPLGSGVSACLSRIVYASYGDPKGDRIILAEEYSRVLGSCTALG